MLKVCVSGATGWTGGAVATAVAAADDMVLVSGGTLLAARKVMGITGLVRGLDQLL